MFSPIVVIGTFVAIFTVLFPIYKLVKNGNLNASFSILWLIYNAIAFLFSSTLTAILFWNDILTWDVFNWVVLFHYVTAIAVLFVSLRKLGR